MHIGRCFGAAARLCLLCSVLAAVSQARTQNRPPGVVTRAAIQASADEQFFFNAANRERSAAGLQPLKWDDALAVAARRHVQLMAREVLLSHRYPGEASLSERAAQAGAKFSMIAENIARGPTAESIHDGWMHSPGHRKNILNSEATAVGIATVKGSGGLFAVQDFSRPVEDLSLKQQEERVVSLLKAGGLTSVSATESARETCRMNRGYAGPDATYLIRFEVTDLAKLPNELLNRVRSRDYQRAAVGACTENDAEGFTRYRIAVLLH
jgi:uncharacterized protein YkwD